MRLSIYLDDQLGKRVQDLAKKSGLSTSQLVALILQNWLASGRAIADLFMM